MAKDADKEVGIVVKGDNGKNPKSYICKVSSFEFAPEPYDVALGAVNYRLETLQKVLRDYGVREWQRVATYGYPLNAVAGDPTNVKINLRVQKGIIQRILAPGDVPIGPSPAAYELSFLIGTGMSGSPLFIYMGDEDIVVGICASCSRTEEIDEVTEIIDGGNKFRETKRNYSPRVR
jgi:hypothetical protein